MFLEKAWALAPSPQGPEGASPGAADPGAAGYLIQFAPLILIFVVFYFLLIRPQQKKQKDLQEIIKSVKKGDKVTTSGGLVGVITDVRETTVILKLGENAKAEVLKSAISGLR